MALTTAFALSPGWWIPLVVVVAVLVALAYSMSSARGSGVNVRAHRRPRSATPAPGADGEPQVTGRDPVRETWQTGHPAQ